MRLSVNDRIVSNPFLNGAPRPLVTFYKDEQVIAVSTGTYNPRPTVHLSTTDTVLQEGRVVTTDLLLRSVSSTRISAVE